MFAGLSGTDIVVVLISLLVSMALHEAMHGFVAYWLGDTTAEDAGRLTLNPLRHIDAMTTVLLPIILVLSHLPPFFAAKPVPFNPQRVRYGEYGVALVGIAGPLTNLALAIIAAALTHFVHVGELYRIFFWFADVNVAFFVFNMIPFPPLDGSRLLYAFAPDFLRELMERIEAAGFLAIAGFVMVLFAFPAAGDFIATVNFNLLHFLLLH